MGDYARDTGHLSLAEHGAYALMLDAFYATGKALPSDAKTLCRLVRADSAVERAAVASIVRQFWHESSDGLVNDRALAEIEKANKQAATNQDIAAAREAAKRAAREERNVQRDVDERSTNRATNGITNGALRARDHSHSQRKEEPTKHCVAVATRFGDFWDAWPRHPRKRDRKACEAKWKARRLDAIADTIIANVKALEQTDEWKRGFIPLPETYLNNDRWNDEVIAAEAVVVDPATGEVKQWHQTANGITAHGASIGVFQDEGELFPEFKARVFASAGHQPVRT